MSQDPIMCGVCHEKRPQFFSTKMYRSDGNIIHISIIESVEVDLNDRQIYIKGKSLCDRRFKESQDAIEWI